MLVAPGPIEDVQANGAEPVALARVADGDVHHRLLVARRVVGQQVVVLLQRLAEAGDVAVAEDAEAAGEEALLAGRRARRAGRRGSGRAPARRSAGSCRDPLELSRSVGIASAHASRAARRARRPRWPAGSCAPAASPRAARARARRRRRRRRRARRRPRPARGGDLDPLLARAREHALGPALDDRELHAELEQRRRRRRTGSRVPTATATSSRLPTATVACASASRAQSPASRLVVPEDRAVVEVVHGHLPGLGALLERGERRAAARLGRQPGAGRPEHARGADRVEVELVRARASCPAPSARGRRAAGSRRAGRSRRRRPACAASDACRPNASSTPKPRSAPRT